MNIRLLVASLTLGLLVAGGCAGPDVHTDFDPSAEFSAFRTFAFSGIMDRGYETGASDKSPLRRRIEQMVEEQLTAKGVRQVQLEDRPDLLLHLFYGVKDERQVQNTGLGPGLYALHMTTYEYHDGGWTPAKINSKTIHEYEEGTLIVDLAKASKHELVWRAVISAALRNSLEENFELADKGIAKAFKDYPPAK